MEECRAPGGRLQGQAGRGVSTPGPNGDGGHSRGGRDQKGTRGSPQDNSAPLRLQPAPSRKLSKHRSGLDAGIRGTQLEEEVLDWLRQAAALAALRGPGGRAPPAGASSVPLADGVSALL